MRTVLKGGSVFYGGRFAVRDVAYAGVRIESVAEDIAVAAGDNVVDVSGKAVLPGLVDLHVHLREPGFGYKETIASGTAAAARGGYTTVCTMPNVNPAPDCAEALERQLEIIRRDAVIKVLPYGTLTRSRRGKGEPADYASLAGRVAGFSDDGCGVQRAEDMERVMRAVAAAGGIVAAHCEDESLLRSGYVHDGEYARAHSHRGICSESEWRQIERDIELVRRTGCRYHVCHISTAESVALVRDAKAEGLPVTCETAPHYLVLCDEDMREEGRFKMNPPLRSRRDMEALLRGVQDGTIDVIATDHAPHSAEEKSRGLERSAMGVVGLETAFGVLYTHLVATGIVPFERLADMMSTAPRRIFGLEPAWTLSDVAVFDLGDEYTVDSASFASKGHATPFDGWRLRGRCVMTIAEGKTVYSNI